MKTLIMKSGILLLILPILLVTPAMAEIVLEVHFDDVPDVTCNEVWTQNGVPCHLTQTTADDCDGGGNCSFDTNDGIALFPARLMVEFAGPTLIYRVEVDFIDYCGVGCSRTFLYNDDLQVGFDDNDLVGEDEILIMDLGADGVLATNMAVSSCEGIVSPSTIRIYSESPLATNQLSWDALKSSYR